MAQTKKQFQFQQFFFFFFFFFFFSFYLYISEQLILPRWQGENNKKQNQ